MFKEILTRLISMKDISREETAEVIRELMEGKMTTAQVGAFLTALRMKGETIEEITGCALVMREKAQKLQLAVDYCVDTCGTGGDASGTFNISTASAFVAAAGGVCVAKHGNRSVSSSSGSADVLEALGVRLELPVKRIEMCIEQIGMGFLFAPAFHPAMKHAVGPRRELGIRTIFNLVGPLTNPANAGGQVMGVFDAALTEPIAGVLKNLGLERALVVCGLDGLDEITLTAATQIAELKNGTVTTYQISPEQYGFTRTGLEELKGGDPAANARIIKSIFSGTRGPQRDIVVLNSGAALYIGKAVASMEQGIQMAVQIIDSGQALKKLNELISFTNSAA